MRKYVQSDIVSTSGKYRSNNNNGSNIGGPQVKSVEYSWQRKKVSTITLIRCEKFSGMAMDEERWFHLSHVLGMDKLKKAFA